MAFNYNVLHGEIFEVKVEAYSHKFDTHELKCLIVTRSGFVKVVGHLML